MCYDQSAGEAALIEVEMGLVNIATKLMRRMGVDDMQRLEDALAAAQLRKNTLCGLFGGYVTGITTQL